MTGALVYCEPFWALDCVGLRDPLLAELGGVPWPTWDGFEPSAGPRGRGPAMLPATAYTSPDVLAWERRHLFAGGWTCLGRLDELLAGAAT